MGDWSGGVNRGVTRQSGEYCGVIIERGVQDAVTML